MQVLAAHRPESLPDHVALTLNLRVLLFSLGASVACALLFGLVPALIGSRTHLHEAMRQGDARMPGGQHRLRVMLVVAEVALALVLVVAAGLTSRALAGLLRLDTGFDGTGVLTFRLSVPEARQRTAQELRDFYERMVGELRALPGVEDASYSTMLPLDGPWETSFRSDAQPQLPPEQVQFAAYVSGLSGVCADARAPGGGRPLVRAGRHPGQSDGDGHRRAARPRLLPHRSRGKTPALR